MDKGVEVLERIILSMVELERERELQGFLQHWWMLRTRFLEVHRDQRNSFFKKKKPMDEFLPRQRAWSRGVHLDVGCSLFVICQVMIK